MTDPAPLDLDALEQLLPAKGECVLLEKAPLRALIAELRRLRAAGEWVACSERMPEDTERVWFWASERVMKGEFRDGRFHMPSLFMWDSGEVSHWMHRPLEPARPSPPVERK